MHDRAAPTLDDYVGFDRAPWGQAPRFNSLWGYNCQMTPVTCDNAGSFSIYTIFEGTSEIQRLIIARSISGVHIR